MEHPRPVGIRIAVVRETRLGLQDERVGYVLARDAAALGLAAGRSNQSITRG